MNGSFQSWFFSLLSLVIDLIHESLVIVEQVALGCCLVLSHCSMLLQFFSSLYRTRWRLNIGVVSRLVLRVDPSSLLCVSGPDCYLLLLLLEFLLLLLDVHLEFLIVVFHAVFEFINTWIAIVIELLVVLLAHGLRAKDVRVSLFDESQVLN